MMTMREYLFRAKTEPCSKDAISGKIELKPKWVYGYIDLGYMQDEKGAIISDEKAHSAYRCQYSTIGQYTGLPDTNNQRIFEGDVVESRASENPEDWKRWLVGWQDGAFWFSTEPKKKRKRTYCLEDTLCEDNIAFYGLVVIGNIHDNPELIKEDAHGTNGM